MLTGPLDGVLAVRRRRDRATASATSSTHTTTAAVALATTATSPVDPEDCGVADAFPDSVGAFSSGDVVAWASVVATAVFVLAGTATVVASAGADEDADGTRTVAPVAVDESLRCTELVDACPSPVPVASGAAADVVVAVALVVLTVVVNGVCAGIVTIVTVPSDTVVTTGVCNVEKDTIVEFVMGTIEDDGSAAVDDCACGPLDDMFSARTELDDSVVVGTTVNSKVVRDVRGDKVVEIKVTDVRVGTVAVLDVCVGEAVALGVADALVVTLVVLDVCVVEVVVTGVTDVRVDTVVTLVSVRVVKVVCVSDVADVTVVKPDQVTYVSSM